MLVLQHVLYLRHNILALLEVATPELTHLLDQIPSHLQHHHCVFPLQSDIGSSFLSQRRQLGEMVETMSTTSQPTLFYTFVNHFSEIEFETC